MIGMKLKFHLSPPMNDGMSLYLTDKSHKSDNFSTINVLCQSLEKYIADKTSGFENFPVHFTPG